MRTLLDRTDRWLLSAAVPQRLALLRILIGIYVVGYLIVRFPVFLDLRDGRSSRFEPVGVLYWLDSPLDGALVAGVLAVAVLSGVLFTVGAGFRITAPTFGLALLILTTYRSSWGQLLHFENLMLLHVLVLAFSPAADVLSVDERRLARGSARASVDPSTAYGWPLRLVSVITVTTYVITGFAKLRYGGLGWLDGDTLRNHIAYASTRQAVFGEARPLLSSPVLSIEWLLTPMAFGAVAIELAAPVSLISHRFRKVWVLLVVAMHVTIALTMSIVFAYQMLGVAFASMFRLERLLESTSLGSSERLVGDLAEQ